jgi:GntP family gluconate:H+ symporter
MEILIALIVVVILMVVAATKFHFHPFLSLLLAGIVMGFVGGLSETEVINVLMNGFGKTLGSIGIIIAFGSIIGAYLEKSGGSKFSTIDILETFIDLPNMDLQNSIALN